MDFRFPYEPFNQKLLFIHPDIDTIPAEAKPCQRTEISILDIWLFNSYPGTMVDTEGGAIILQHLYRLLSQDHSLGIILFI